MKVLASRFVDLARVLKPSATQAKADTEVDVPARLASVTEFPSALTLGSGNLPAASSPADSFWWNNDVLNTVGNAAVDQESPLLSQGLYHLTGFLVVDGQIAAGFNRVFLSLREPAPSVLDYMLAVFYLRPAVGAAVAFRIDVVASFLDAGWKLHLHVPATPGAGDGASVTTGISLNRLL